MGYRKVTAVGALRIRLRELLFEAAIRSQPGSSHADSMMAGAARLEDGKTCPEWMARPFKARAIQDVLGVMGMALPETEKEELFMAAIGPSR